MKHFLSIVLVLCAYSKIAFGAMPNVSSQASPQGAANAVQENSASSVGKNNKDPEPQKSFIDKRGMALPISPEIKVREAPQIALPLAHPIPAAVPVQNTPTQAVPNARDPVSTKVAPYNKTAAQDSNLAIPPLPSLGSGYDSKPQNQVQDAEKKDKNPAPSFMDRILGRSKPAASLSKQAQESDKILESMPNIRVHGTVSAPATAPLPPVQAPAPAIAPPVQVVAPAHVAPVVQPVQALAPAHVAPVVQPVQALAPAHVAPVAPPVQVVAPAHVAPVAQPVQALAPVHVAPAAPPVQALAPVHVAPAAQPVQALAPAHVAPVAQPVQALVPAHVALSAPPVPAPAVWIVPATVFTPTPLPVGQIAVVQLTPSAPTKISPAIGKRVLFQIKGEGYGKQIFAKGKASSKAQFNIPTTIAHNDTKSKIIAKKSEFEKFEDSELIKFIQDEVSMLSVPDDDVVLGKMTYQAKFADMGYSQYLTIYQMYRDNVKRRAQVADVIEFIIYHRKIDGNDLPIFSDKYLFTTAVESIKNGKLDNLRALANNYKLLGLIDSRGNGLLHVAAFTDNVAITKWLIMRGSNINAMNYDAITPLDVAKHEQYLGVANLLEAADAR